MRTGRLKSALSLSSEERLQLESIAHSRTLPHRLARRAAMVLMSIDGQPNAVIAKQFQVSQLTVSGWRKRYRGLARQIAPGAPAPA
jgi:putative transposase